MKDMPKLPVTCHQKRDMNHFIYLNSKTGDYFLRCRLCAFGLILRQGNRSSNGWFGLLSFPFCGKNNPEQARKNCRVLRVFRMEGEFFAIPTVFPLEGSIEKKC